MRTDTGWQRSGDMNYDWTIFCAYMAEFWTRDWRVHAGRVRDITADLYRMLRNARHLELVPDYRADFYCPDPRPDIYADPCPFLNPRRREVDDRLFDGPDDSPIHQHPPRSLERSSRRPRPWPRQLRTTI